MAWRLSSMLKMCCTAHARLMPRTRPSHGAWKTGSFFSRSTRPKPCIPPMSWIPFTSRDPRVALCNAVMILSRNRAEQQARELLRLAQHRVVAGIELVPGALQALGRPALVRLGRIRGAPAADDGRGPGLAPEAAERDRRLERRDRGRRSRSQGP